MTQIDILPYKTFLRLKAKFPVKTVLVDAEDATTQGLMLLFKDHRAYIAHLFAKQGVEITRWSTEYRTLDGSDPKLGLTYLANDSVITPGVEVHALIGHNARYLDKASGDIDGI